MTTASASGWWLVHVVDVDGDGDGDGDGKPDATSMTTIIKPPQLTAATNNPLSTSSITPITASHAGLVVPPDEQIESHFAADSHQQWTRIESVRFQTSRAQFTASAPRTLPR
jgi:hypothetical protein